MCLVNLDLTVLGALLDYPHEELSPLGREQSGLTLEGSRHAGDQCVMIGILLVLLEPMHILVVEDEKKMADLLKKGLEEESHFVTVAYDRSFGIQRIPDGSFAPW